jgi:hypothetical protein
LGRDRRGRENSSFSISVAAGCLFSVSPLGRRWAVMPHRRIQSSPRLRRSHQPHTTQPARRVPGGTGLAVRDCAGLCPQVESIEAKTVEVSASTWVVEGVAGQVMVVRRDLVWCLVWYLHLETEEHAAQRAKYASTRGSAKDEAALTARLLLSRAGRSLSDAGTRLSGVLYSDRHHLLGKGAAASRSLARVHTLSS